MESITEYEVIYTIRGDVRNVMYSGISLLEATKQYNRLINTQKEGEEFLLLEKTWHLVSTTPLHRSIKEEE